MLESAVLGAPKAPEFFNPSPILWSVSVFGQTQITLDFFVATLNGATFPTRK